MRFQTVVSSSLIAIGVIAAACDNDDDNPLPDRDTGFVGDTAPVDTGVDTGRDPGGDAGDGGLDAPDGDTAADTRLRDTNPSDTTASDTDGGVIERDVGAGTTTLTLDVSNNPLPPLGKDHQWQGWLVDEDVNTPFPTPTPRFEAEKGKTSYTWEVPAGKANDADRFVLTIEPQPDFTEGPSTAKLLAGDFEGKEADLTTAPVGDFSNVSGTYLLNAPTAESAMPTHGVWFLDNAGDSPAASLQNLPELADKGWTYEGWIVPTTGSSPRPVTTGKFADAAESWTEADRDGAGPSAGPNTDAAPAFPGQDFVGGDPGGNNFDLTEGGSWKVRITVEPEVGPSGDNSSEPFSLLKLMSASIAGDAAAKTPIDLDSKAGDLPTATVTIE